VTLRSFGGKRLFDEGGEFNRDPARRELPRPWTSSDHANATGSGGIGGNAMTLQFALVSSRYAGLMRRLVIGILVVLGMLAAVPAYYALVDGKLPPLLAVGEPVALEDGTRLNVVQRGDGPTVVLVHGVFGNANGWGSLPDLLVASGRRVVLYDRKGYGGSDRRRNGERHTFDANAQELTGLLAALELRDVTVVGWSYGGGTALRAVTLDPDRIGSVVLIGGEGPALRLPAASFATRVASLPPVSAWIARVPPLSERLLRLFAQQVFGTERPPSWWIANTMSSVNLPGVRETQQAEIASLDVSVLRPERVSRPMLVIHGTDDRLIPIRVAEDVHALSAGRSRIIRVRGGGHMLPLTHARLVAEWIIAFSSMP
jgi:non-heme chloroperoxidase